MLEQTKQDAALSATLTNSTQQTLFDYFAGEVLQRAAPPLQEILLKTAFIPHITTEMAVALTGNRQAGDLLDALAARNYFTYRHEDETLHYEYHPLFADFLKKQVQGLYDEAALKQLRGESARLLADAGRDEHAFQLYCDAGDWPATIELITRQAPLFLKQGRDQIIRQWIQQLPAALLTSQPWLVFWLGASTLAYNPNEAYRHFEQAFEFFRQQQDLRGTLYSWMGAVDSVIYSLSNGARLDRWLGHFEELRQHYSFDNEPGLEGQLAPRVLGILFLRYPDHPELTHWYDKAEHAIREIADINQRMLNGFYLFGHHIWRGDLASAAALLEALVREDPANFPPLAATTCYFSRAWLAWSRGDYALCQTNINQGLALAEQTGVYVWYAMLLMMGSTNAFIHSRPDEAETYLKRLTPGIIEIRDMDRAYYYNDRAGFNLAAGDLLHALENQQLAIRAADDLGAVYTNADACYGMALVLHAMGERSQAEHYLQQAAALGRRNISWTKAIQCALLEAQFALDAGDDVKAITILKTIFEQIRQKGFVTFNSWQPTAIARLFAFCLRHNISNDIITSLIQQYRLPVPQGETGPTWPWPVRIRTLGQFVLEVNDKAVDLSGNKHRRPCDLLKLLIAAEPHGISEAHLAEILWPEQEGDTAMRNLRTNLHRLRRLLGSDDAVQVRQGQAGLNRQRCWLDIATLNHLLFSIPGTAKEKLAALADELLDSYPGPFLPAYDEPHILACRQQLQQHFITGMSQLEMRLRTTQQGDVARALGERLIERVEED